LIIKSLKNLLFITIEIKLNIIRTAKTQTKHSVMRATVGICKNAEQPGWYCDVCIETKMMVFASSSKV
jgi:hypothetical protein